MSEPLLFTPIQLRDVTLKNRVVVASAPPAQAYWLAKRARR